MTGDERTRAAASAGLLASEDTHRELLQSIVEVARAIFYARASSILLLDDEANELVFEAVAGEGSSTLVGNRFPADSGISGWVLAAREPLVIEDVAADPRFAKGVAESTGFVPRGLMSVPLLEDERALGVLSVLDRPQEARFSLAEMDLLGLFAKQAAIAVDLVGRARRAKAFAAGGDDDMAAVSRLASELDSLEGTQREAGLRLVGALADVVARR